MKRPGHWGGRKKHLTGRILDGRTWDEMPLANAGQSSGEGQEVRVQEGSAGCSRARRGDALATPAGWLTASVAAKILRVSGAGASTDPTFAIVRQHGKRRQVATTVAKAT